MRVDYDLINTEYENIVPEFKPVFGNDLHIDIGKSIAVINKLEKELERFPTDSAKSRVLKEEIYHKKRNVIYAIKNNV